MTVFMIAPQRIAEEFYRLEAGSVCGLVRDTLEQCVAVFSRCHSSREVRRIKVQLTTTGLREILQCMEKAPNSFQQ